jgi:oligoribonuclease
MSGLSKSVLESKTTIKEAESIVYEFTSKYIPKGMGIIAGNSVHFDKEFLRHHMPTFFSYKILDVSTLRQLINDWYPELPDYKKSGTHRALLDIKESIQELNYLQNICLRKSN